MSNNNTFPLCGTCRTIPYSLAERAYEQYVKRYGKSQTLKRLAERGGFYPEEMDSLYPGWREEVEEIYLLRKEIERLRSILSKIVSEATTLATIAVEGLNNDSR